MTLHLLNGFVSRHSKTLCIFYADECSMIVCRAGRECRVNTNGEAACRCVANCPDHFVPVCGSNNVSYDNFCLMHRDACLTGVHISLKKKGYCSNKPAKKKKTKSNKTETLATKEDALFEPGSITFKCSPF